MLVRRLSQLLREHSWFGVSIDIAVVVASILLALQLDAWAERRAERRLEQSYLTRLVEDLEIERSTMDAAERYANERIDAARYLDALASEVVLATDDPQRVLWALETSTWRSFPQINAFVYRELQATGRLALIRSERIRRSLAEHYTALQHDSRVGEDLSAQQRFDAAVSGILNIEELEAIERVAGDHSQLTVSPERATAIARSFVQRPTAIAELPSLVQHHTFNLRVIVEMRGRADRIIADMLAARSAAR